MHSINGLQENCVCDDYLRFAPKEANSIEKQYSTFKKYLLTQNPGFIPQIETAEAKWSSFQTCYIRVLTPPPLFELLSARDRFRVESINEEYMNQQKIEEKVNPTTKAIVRLVSRT